MDWLEERKRKVNSVGMKLKLKYKLNCNGLNQCSDERIFEFYH